MVENNSLAKLYEDLFDNNIHKREEYGDVIESFNFFIEQKLSKDLKILEIGCNIGSLLNLLYQVGYKNIVGIDLATNAVYFGKKKYDNIADILIVAEGTHLPFKNHIFDVVISFDVFEHIPDVNQHLREVKRVLKSNQGTYIFQTPNKIINIPWEIISHMDLYNWKNYHCSLQTYFTLKKILVSNGFKVILISNRKIESEYTVNKIIAKFGKSGLVLIYILNKFPLLLTPHFWVKANTEVLS